MILSFVLCVIGSFDFNIFFLVSSPFSQRDVDGCEVKSLLVLFVNIYGFFIYLFSFIYFKKTFHTFYLLSV